MDGHLRISDADRAAAENQLARHRRAGRLRPDEVPRRTAAVREAVTRNDLHAVLADLPNDRRASRGWHNLVWRAHLLLFAVTAGATILLWEVVRDPDPLPRDYGADYWWPLWFVLSWAAIVLGHLLSADVAARRLQTRPPSPAAVAFPPPAVGGTRSVPPSGAAPSLSVTTKLAALTAREREVLALLGSGLANQEIARELVISERTARTHVSNILRKLDLTSRTQAALVATSGNDG